MVKALIKLACKLVFAYALVCYLAIIFMVGCGTSQDYTNSSTKESEKSSTSMTTVNGQNLNSDAFSVSGYVTPINITVDGKVYKDTEDFYTQELRRLQAQVKEQYSGYKLSFDASIGLRNFKNGMYVFLAAISDIGVASESYVDASGKFSFLLEGKTERNVMYTMRATKRISLKLTKGKEVITWCYNMYAEKEVSLDGKPVILRQFGTAVTEYQCSDPANGIQLPDRQYTVEEEENMKADQKERERTAVINDAAKEAIDKATNKANEAVKDAAKETPTTPAISTLNSPTNATSSTKEEAAEVK